MPETIGGIPIHPLVVHGVVVLIPLAALGVILIAFIPKWRERYGSLVVILALLPLLMIPVAKQSGEQLKEVVGDSDAVKTHAELGEVMLYFAIPLFLVATALWWVGRRERQHQPIGKGLSLTLAVVSVIVAISASVWVARVGHSGSDAAWGGLVISEDG